MYMRSNKTIVKQLPIQPRKNCKFKVTGVECQFLHIPDYHIIRYRFKSLCMITLRSWEFLITQYQNINILSPKKKRYKVDIKNYFIVNMKS